LQYGTYQPRIPKKRKQASAPTIDRDNPQISRFRKRRCLFSCSPAQAMQSAPRVDSGEVSTRWEPMLIEEIVSVTSDLYPSMLLMLPVEFLFVNRYVRFFQIGFTIGVRFMDYFAVAASFFVEFDEGASYLLMRMYIGSVSPW